MPPPYAPIPPTPIITPLVNTTFGQNFDNLTQSNFSLLYFPGNALSPYSWATMGQMAFPYFLMFFFLYGGMWFSHGNLKLASIVGLLFAGSFLFAGGGLGISMPAVIVPICYGALVASLTGIVMSMFKNIG